MNQSTNLSDGAVLSVTTGLAADRAGKTFSDAIAPDLTVEVEWTEYGSRGDRVLSAGIEWLASTQDEI